MTIRDVLRAKGRAAICIDRGATVSDAVARLVENNIGSLPVVAEDGRLVGIFTERDVLRGVHRRGESFCRAPLSDAMTPDPVTCEPDDSVHDAMGRMSDYQIGQLPVVAEGSVVGVVSVGDVIKLLHDRAESENQHLLNYVYGPL